MKTVSFCVGARRLADYSRLVCQINHLGRLCLADVADLARLDRLAHLDRLCHLGRVGADGQGGSQAVREPYRPRRGVQIPLNTPKT